MKLLIPFRMRKKNSAIESPSYLKGFDLWGNLSFGLIFEKRFIKIFQ